ncbi:hypothetical protein GE061_006382 [Apolygus lucorum]|uniref:Cystatin domain-containing protein n=1 Tax=Apolygus lucorum TaxID=248454 RepID=A0A8S9WVG6_APOLU|nr:hypothetical protein GE061_006382 [Apolygus lucorum]
MNSNKIFGRIVALMGLFAVNCLQRSDPDQGMSSREITKFKEQAEKWGMPPVRELITGRHRLIHLVRKQSEYVYKTDNNKICEVAVVERDPERTKPVWSCADDKRGFWRRAMSKAKKALGFLG